MASRPWAWTIEQSLDDASDGGENRLVCGSIPVGVVDRTWLDFGWDACGSHPGGVGLPHPGSKISVGEEGEAALRANCSDSQGNQRIPRSKAHGSGGLMGKKTG